MRKERIDKLLADRGFAESRAKAQAMVMAGIVLVDEQRVDKSSQMFSAEAPIRIKGDSPESRYVSRAGLKLEAALKHFKIDPVGWSCLDIGSSTGGFTDCLLRHGAASVVALDVGTNQLAWSIRNDPRVEVRENTNARALLPGDFSGPFDIIVMDVSFISATKILPALPPLLRDGGRMVVLIKPQFEVEKGEVGKGGIVRDPDIHVRVVHQVNGFAERLGLSVLGTIDSPITGAEGNKEFLACYENLAPKVETPEKRLTEGTDYYFEEDLMVLTEKFLRDRGYCCGNGCRHCPYPKSPGQSKKSSSSL